jgi:hypothetical protein
MRCPNCNEHLEGDGYAQVLHCPNSDSAEIESAEPDAPAIYCTGDVADELPKLGVPCDKCGRIVRECPGFRGGQWEPGHFCYDCYRRVITPDSIERDRQYAERRQQEDEEMQQKVQQVYVELERKRLLKEKETKNDL